MSRIIKIVFLPLLIWTQSISAQMPANEDTSMCKYAAEHMINVAKESLQDKNSRPERTEKRRKLAEEWSSRIASGEDPCQVYEDIQKAATTF
tara:strand:+ start:183 stop:458 length:276 start_codon:yes stop_codon:yes gene_type:complete